MGFTAGLYIYPKKDDNNLTRDQLHYIERYLNYEKESWVKEHFNSAHDYAIENITDLEFQVPTQETIDFFKEHATETEYNTLHIYKEFCNWCSNGDGDIYDWFLNLNKISNFKDSTCIELTSKDLYDFAQFCLGNIIKNFPIPCNINYTFKYLNNNDDDDEFLEEEPEIRLSPCDGIEYSYETEEGTSVTARIDTNSKFEYGTFYIAENQDYDEWSTSGYVEGLKGTLQALEYLTRNPGQIFYSGGW